MNDRSKESCDLHPGPGGCLAAEKHEDEHPRPKVVNHRVDGIYYIWPQFGIERLIAMSGKANP